MFACYRVTANLICISPMGESAIMMMIRMNVQIVFTFLKVRISRKPR